MHGEFSSGLVKVHNGLRELDESGLGGISLAVSSGVEHLLLGSDESGSHFLGILGVKLLFFERGDGNLS